MALGISALFVFARAYKIANTVLDTQLTEVKLISRGILL